MSKDQKTGEAYIETYLEVVASQLPKDQAEDIVAELRDDILARKEDREETLGRALTPNEIEALLREVGHPLVVAARYGRAGQSLIGPELYPWVMFAARLGLITLGFMALVQALLLMANNGLDLGDALTSAIGEFVRNVLTLAGGLAIGGWIIERQDKKPKFLTEWKVADLSMFAWAGSIERSGVDFLRGNVSARHAQKGTPLESRSDFSPVAGATASAIFTMVVLLWWTGLLGGVRYDPGHLWGASDVGSVLGVLHSFAYWPVAGLLAARVIFDIARVLLGSPVRFTAAGDFCMSVAGIALMSWIWVASPLGDRIRVANVPEFWQRVSDKSVWATEPMLTVIMVILVVGVLSEIVRAVQALASLVLNRKIGGTC